MKKKGTFAELMKKTCAAILCFLYLAASLHTGVTLHYCCGKLAQVAVSFGTVATAQRPSCPMQASYWGNNCCRDVHTPISVSHDQSRESPSVLTSGAFAGILFPSPALTPSRPSLAGYFSVHPPPLPAGPPVYLTNCRFQI